jgi:hypothetical protein
VSAILSECGRYRYRLERTVASTGPVYAFIGVNPSTADAELDDATVRKWKGFVSRWGGSRFIVGNVFGFRATDVKALARAADPTGADNAAHLNAIVADADIIIPCWGDRGKLPPRLRPSLDSTLSKLHRSDKPVMVFGFSKGGDPLHPLMLGYATALRPSRQDIFS